MSTTPDVMRLLAEERTWATEGPKHSEVEHPVLLQRQDSWEALAIQFEPWATAAVRIDEQLLLDREEFVPLASKGYLSRRNPRFVVIRIVDPKTKVRTSAIFIRGDLFPNAADYHASQFLRP